MVIVSKIEATVEPINDRQFQAIETFAYSDKGYCVTNGHHLIGVDEIGDLIFEQRNPSNGVVQWYNVRFGNLTITGIPPSYLREI